jgi:hypothetical protein
MHASVESPGCTAGELRSRAAASACPSPEAMTRALREHWQRVAEESAASRLATVVSASEQDDTTPQLLAIHALADTDEQVVFTATRRYLELASGPEAVAARAHALQWVARGLALRPAAVFAALLAHGDPTTREALTSARSTTTSLVVRRLLTRFAAETRHAREFLAEWGALESTPVTR